MKKRVIKSKLFNKLSRTANVFHVRTSNSTQAGIKVEESGNKKRTMVEMVLPSTDIDGKYRVVRVLMSGRQARAFAGVLNQYYND